MDQKRLKIAYHEIGHAVTALLCNRAVQKISLKEMDSPNGSDKYLGHITLAPTDPNEVFTVNKAIENVRISLGGFACEVLFFNDVPGIPVDDLDKAIKNTEGLLSVKDFRDHVTKMSILEPDVVPRVTDPLMRAFIYSEVNRCVEVLSQMKPAIQNIVQELLKKEELTGEEVFAILNSSIHSS